MKTLHVHAAIVGVLLLIARADPAVAQIALSSRLGTVIDSLDREYFGLFPQERHFRTAQVEAAGSGFSVRIFRPDGTDTVVALAGDIVKRLGNYIDNFEQIADGSIALDSTLGRYARPQPVAQVPPVVTVFSDFGPVEEYRILLVDERGLLLVSTDVGEYRPGLVDGAIKAFGVEAAERIIISEAGAPFLGALAAFGGAIPALVYGSADRRPLGASLALPAGLTMGAVLTQIIHRTDLAMDWKTDRAILQRHSMFPDIAPRSFVVFR